MKENDKKHLIKSFLIFFISLEILNMIVFNFYYKEQKNILLNSIFSELKDYNYNFENENIKMDISKNLSTNEKYKLYVDDKEIYSYFDLLDSKSNLLKLSYDYKKYNEQLDDKFYKTLGLFILITIILFIYSFIYSIYTLKPYKKSIELLERFLKDIIHDLNTPISSIMINTSILKRKHNLDAVNRIELSGKTISNLYKNLEQYILKNKFNLEKINLLPIVKQRVDYFQKLYPELEFQTPDTSFIVQTNEIAIIRILDNIISNSCKYNKQKGKVIILFKDNKIIIEDTGYGMKNPSRAFDRFYKESDRGMGIGLNIVNKLSKELDINISLSSIINEGTIVTLYFKGCEKND